MTIFQIGLQSDSYPGRCGARESSSEKYAKIIKRAGHQVKPVDVFSPIIISQLKGCDGFIWRHGHYPEHRAVAKRLLPAIEYNLSIPVYPDQNTCWHYDDKLSQFYLFEAAGIPQPETNVFWRQEDAMRYLATAKFPLVLKMWSGAASTNVKMISSREEAVKVVKVLFCEGVYRLVDDETGLNVRRSIGRIRRASKWVLFGKRWDPGPWYDLHKNYVLFQEFLDGNAFDTRVTVIGNRAFCFRRFNRPDDFRASGSGLIDWNPEAVDPRFISLAYRVSRVCKTQSCAIDGLYRREEVVAAENTYTFASWAVHECPGHYELVGDPEKQEWRWISGRMWPEEAQMQDFLALVGEHKAQGLSSKEMN